MKKEWISSSVLETFEVAKEIGNLILTHTIPSWVFLIGDIGSGKTTFVRGFLSLWDSEDMVSSPTFSLIHHYPHPQFSVYHVDLYRVRSFEEIEEIGLFDLFHEDNIIFVEWAELLEKTTKTINIPYAEIRFVYGENETSRIISLSCKNP